MAGETPILARVEKPSQPLDLFGQVLSVTRRPLLGISRLARKTPLMPMANSTHVPGSGVDNIKVLQV
jgi:hypothetical protein